MFEYPELETTRLELIYLSFDYLDDMWEYSREEELYQYFEFKPFESKEETKDYLFKLFTRVEKDKSLYWFIKSKIHNKVIGSFGVTDIDGRRKNCEIGFAISPKYQKMGFFNEALLSVISYLFSSGFHRISAKTYTNNQDCINGLKKVGFRQEGIMRDFYLDDTNVRHDAMILGLLEGDFIE